MRQVVSGEIEMEMANGNVKDLNIEGFVHYHVDKYFGADADGNRGEVRTIIDDVIDVNVYDMDGNDVEITSPQRETVKAKLVTIFMEN